MKKVAIILFCFIGLICKAQNPNFEWAKLSADLSSGASQEAAIITDANGNAYTCGNLNGTADFEPWPGTYKLPCMGGTEVFISKLLF
ncbi:MAG: hypothetical protein IPJ60_03625 [Sphingobacteriaceae bacterium]|nr:hypothetical protein [Sphingobacteriaceae bacterium]